MTSLYFPILSVKNFSQVHDMEEGEMGKKSKIIDELICEWPLTTGHNIFYVLHILYRSGL